MDIIEVDEKQEKQFKDYADNILNPALFEDGKEYRGLALLVKITEGTTGSGKPFLRLFLKGTRNQVFQVNLHLAYGDYSTAKRYKSFIKEIMYIEIQVQSFMGIMLGNVIGKCESFTPPEGTITKESFTPSRRDRDNLLKEFAKYERLFEEAQVPTVVREQMRTLGFLNLLEKCALNDLIGERGDSLKLFLDLANHYERMFTTESKVELAGDLIQMFTFVALDTFWKNSKEVNNSLLKDTTVNKILTLSKYSKQALSALKCDDSYNHLLSVMYTNEDPKTFLAKVLSETYSVFEKQIVMKYYFDTMSKGDEKKFLEEDYIKL